MMKRIFLTIALILFASEAYATTGDILATDIHATASASDNGVRTVITGAECYSGGTGECIKLICTQGASGGDCQGSSVSWDVAVPAGHKSITVVYYERFNIWPLHQTTGGIKSSRPYYNSGDSDYQYAILTGFFDDSIYMSSYHTDSNLMRFKTAPNNDAVTWIRTYTDNSYDYCQDDGGGPAEYVCGRLQFDWTPGMQTEWREIRHWIKLPTDNETNDGESMLWVDGVLLYHTYEHYVKATAPASPTWARIGVAPVEETTQAHYHYYDELTIYEGYVPPGGGDVTAPTITGFVIPATSSSLTVPISTFTATDDTAVTGYCLVEVDSSAGCSWSGTAQTEYAFTTQGAKTLYAFARDAALNVSSSSNDSVTVTLAQVSPGTTSSSIGKGITGSSIGKSWTVGP